MNLLITFKIQYDIYVLRWYRSHIKREWKHFFSFCLFSCCCQMHLYMKVFLTAVVVLSIPKSTSKWKLNEMSLNIYYIYNNIMYIYIIIFSNYMSIFVSIYDFFLYPFSIQICRKKVIYDNLCYICRFIYVGIYIYVGISIQV